VTEDIQQKQHLFISLKKTQKHMLHQNKKKRIKQSYEWHRNSLFNHQSLGLCFDCTSLYKVSEMLQQVVCQPIYGYHKQYSRKSYHNTK